MPRDRDLTDVGMPFDPDARHHLLDIPFALLGNLDNRCASLFAAAPVLGGVLECL